MKCKTCRFIEPVKCPDCDEIAVGKCRRFPPKPDGKGTHSIDEFPTVRPDYDWCGEYKKGAKK